MYLHKNLNVKIYNVCENYNYTPMLFQLQNAILFYTVIMQKAFNLFEYYMSDVEKDNKILFSISS